MGKELCKIKELCVEDFEAYTKRVSQPKVICTKCGRAANKKKFVCSPRKIGKAMHNNR